jgi:hypothetical protein
MQTQTEGSIDRATWAKSLMEPFKAHPCPFYHTLNCGVIESYDCSTKCTTAHQSFPPISKEDILAVKVGSVIKQHTMTPKYLVVRVAYEGISVKGHAYKGVDVQFGTGATMSTSCAEGEPCWQLCKDIPFDFSTLKQCDHEDMVNEFLDETEFDGLYYEEGRCEYNRDYILSRITLQACIAHALKQGWFDDMNEWNTKRCIDDQVWDTIQHAFDDILAADKYSYMVRPERVYIQREY